MTEKNDVDLVEYWKAQAIQASAQTQLEATAHTKTKETLKIANREIEQLYNVRTGALLVVLISLVGIVVETGTLIYFLIR